MTGCELGLGKTFDLGLCAHSLFLGWVPDWVWVLAPYWPWLVVVIGAGVAYRFAGWPGVVAFAGAFGYLAGRLAGRKKPIEPIENVDPGTPDAAPSHGFNDFIKPRPKNPTGKHPRLTEDELRRITQGSNK